MALKHKFGLAFGLAGFYLVNLALAAVFINLENHPNSIFQLNSPTENLVVTAVAVLLLLIVQLALNGYSVYSSVKNEPKIEFYPTVPENLTVEDRHWGKYTPEQLQSIVKKVSQNANQQVRSAFIGTEVIPRITSYNFRGPVLYINSNLLHVCAARELEAAIAGELGYTKGRLSSLATYLNYHSKSFLAPLYLIPLFFHLRAMVLTWFNSAPYTFTANRVITQVFVLIGLILAISVVWNVHELFIKAANRSVQYMADEEGARLVGKRNMINMLVKLGQRTEALDVLLEEVKWLESLQWGKIYSFDEERLLEVLPFFPPNELSEEKARQMAPTIFLRARLSNLRHFYHLDLPEVEDKIEEAAAKLRKQRVEYLEEAKKKAKDAGQPMPEEVGTIDWRHADKDGNLDLDDDEIEHFVELLQEDHKKLLFENEVAQNALFRRRLPINKRILAVYHLNL